MKLTRKFESDAYQCGQIGYGEVLVKKNCRVHFWIYQIYALNQSYWIVAEVRNNGESYLDVQQQIICRQKKLIIVDWKIHMPGHYYLLEEVAYDTLKRCLGMIGNFVWVN